MQLGSTPSALLTWPDETTSTETVHTEALFHLAHKWLKADREVRRAREKESGRLRGPRAAEETRDARTFFEKYDYSH